MGFNSGFKGLMGAVEWNFGYHNVVAVPAAQGRTQPNSETSCTLWHSHGCPYVRLEGILALEVQFYLS